MRRLIKISLILGLLAWAAIGLNHVRGQRGSDSTPRNSFAATGSRPHEKITVRADDGSFVLKNLKLVRMTGSTVVKGSVVNKTNQRREQVSFELRAYGHDGEILKGLEGKTIFTAQELKANGSTPINHGYGVWLQGIPLESIARIEVVETSVETASVPLWSRLSSHPMILEKDAEIEE